MMMNNFNSFDDVLAFHKVALVHRKQQRGTNSRLYTVMFTLDDFENDEDNFKREPTNNADNGSSDGDPAEEGETVPPLT